MVLISGFISEDYNFPINEQGKYHFSEVVEIPGLDKEQLYENGTSFMKKIKVLNSKKKYLYTDIENLTLKSKGSFMVYKIGSIKKSIAGAVEYNIQLEFKDGKCRYTISSFTFNEYKRNRYGKYEPVKGKHSPLEMEVSSLNKKEWEKHRQVVYEKTQDLIQNLQSDLIQYEEPKTKKSKKNDNW